MINLPEDVLSEGGDKNLANLRISIRHKLRLTWNKLSYNHSTDKAESVSKYHVRDKILVLR